MTRQSTKRRLELLSPAANKLVAIEAIRHGADAVYIGASSHGARKSAANSIDDIAEVADFAHTYRARVYTTVNTLVYDNEIKRVETLIKDLYHEGVDAIIVQDMSILRMNIPPIALHASTQCDIRTPEKAKFMQEVGFSQLVLPRELSLPEIREIREAVDIPLEFFVHGALCVSYSGRCSASQLSLGRSANRGECAQMCRLPYNLENDKGERILTAKHLLSLRDFNSLNILDLLIKAGVDSFKIEGRLKEADYVKNVTAAYSARLNEYIAAHRDIMERASAGMSDISFSPQLDKSFNRGFTSYFLEGRGTQKIASLDTPKSMGEIITDINQLNNGDGISYFDRNGDYAGINVNRVENGRIISHRPFNLPKDTQIHRTFDREWKNLMQKDTAKRTLRLNIKFDMKGITASDERGVAVRLGFSDDMVMDRAKKSFDLRAYFDKFGGTPFRIASFESDIPEDIFIPASFLSGLRRELLRLLDNANKTTYKYDYRRTENMSYQYPTDTLTRRDNVANALAKEFYLGHGVRNISPAVEISDRKELSMEKELCVMTTRYCLRRELGCCKKLPVNSDMAKKLKEPLFITSGPHRFRLAFDCSDCEMKVLKKSKD